MWFKEYTFNVIIQPFHLILYTVLVGAAIDLATESLIYAVIALYFLIPAEKLLRKFFGFDNAGTLSAAGSFAGGAVFSAMISKLNRPKPKGEKEEEKPKNLRKNTSAGTVDADSVLSRTRRWRRRDWRTVQAEDLLEEMEQVDQCQQELVEEMEQADQLGGPIPLGGPLRRKWPSTSRIKR